MTMTEFPTMLVGKTEFEGTDAEQAQEKAMYYSGFLGWSIYGALSAFNVIYYFDVYKRQLMDNDHSSWDKMAFWTIMGAASWIRLHISIIGWFVMSFFWMISMGGWTFPILHTFFYGLAEIFLVIWLARILIIIMMELMGLILDNHLLTHSVFNYYQHGHAYGAELGVDPEYNSIDIEMEAFNVLAQAMAFALYSIAQPLYQSQINNTSVIATNGASCQLCFKKRQTAVDETQPESKNQTTWVRNCNKIRNECELEARREAAQTANRLAIAESGSTDFIM